MIAVEGVPQAVLQHGVDHLELAHLGAVAQMRGVRRLAHALLTAHHHDRGVAVADRLPAEGDGAQAGAAELIDAQRGLLDRNARIDRGLAGRVLALTGTQDLAHDDFVDFLGLDLGALQRALDGDLAQIMSRHSAEGAIERADGRARCARDDDFRCHVVLLAGRPYRLML